MNNHSMKRRWLNTIPIFILLVVFIGVTRWFTEQNGTQSHTESRAVATFLENSVAENFTINRNDVFWKTTIDDLVRKVAHFTEYLLVGAFLNIMLNVITKKVWLSFLVSVPICVILAYLDEFRQKFIAGRNPTWFDVRVDSYGALFGIVLTAIFFIVYLKIKKLNREIKILEEKLSSLDNVELHDNS